MLAPLSVLNMHGEVFDSRTMNIPEDEWADNEHQLQYSGGQWVFDLSKFGCDHCIPWLHLDAFCLLNKATSNILWLCNKLDLQSSKKTNEARRTSSALTDILNSLTRNQLLPR